MKQSQFLEVIDRDEAERRFQEALDLAPLGSETIRLADALGRVLADDVRAAVDVPCFDRSNYDGYAVCAADVVGAREGRPRRLKLLAESVAAGRRPAGEVGPQQAMAVATGGMIPRGADAVVMVEHADAEGDQLEVRRASAAGFGISSAGSDVAAGETVLRAGTLLTSRETGVLAAIGCGEAVVWRQPIVAILSTGDELVPPGQPIAPAEVYDSNTQILADAVRELGAEPLVAEIVSDDVERLRRNLHELLPQADIVLLSGGTSKGEGDLCYRVVAELDDPGIVAHGVALKPGKPICLAVSRNKPVVILPGFPTSAIFTFHEFVAPVIRRYGGRTEDHRNQHTATMAVRVNSEVGRTEYLLVGLVRGDDSLSAYPMGKGSGSVTTFSRADGFVTIDRHTEMVEAGEQVEVQLLGRDLRVADLVVLGSHCAGLDWLLSQMSRRGYVAQTMPLGSTAGLDAVRRGQADLAGIHLLDPVTGEYNRPFIDDSIEWVAGYGRKQGIVYRRGDPRFEGRTIAEILSGTMREERCLMVNRNAGSGTRVLIDQLLAEAAGEGAEPAGYQNQTRSHNAVAAAVAQERADWGMAIEQAAQRYDLGFVPCRDEQFDFVIPRSRLDREPVRAFLQLLGETETREQLTAMGFELSSRSA